MAVDTSFASLFESLKVEDPWLPPRTWESIPAESGASHSNASTSQLSLTGGLCDTSAVSEASLVRLAMNALHGVEAALLSIEKLCSAFCSDPADRTSNRIPNLWNRSSSTLALGNVLKSIGRFGCLVFLLRKFVDYFTIMKLDGNAVGNKHENSEPPGNQIDHDIEREKLSPYSLVNQAFSIAVRKVLDGYICALDTLSASVGLRCSLKTGGASSCPSSGLGCLMSVVHSEITLLEVYLHTKELRTQIEALGNICDINDVAFCFLQSSFQEITTKANLGFLKFARGGDLLTSLYTQLKVADPAHCALLKFLFLRSCEPYCGFVKSLIYSAKIDDPYKEFMVEYAGNPLSDSNLNDGICIDFSLPTIRERDGVAVPCFLKDYLIPLLRAGQQLQVLIKLLELCSHVGAGKFSYKDILSCWSEFPESHASYSSSITFNKGRIKAILHARTSYYKLMRQKVKNLSRELGIRYQQVFQDGSLSIFVDNIKGSRNTPIDEGLVSVSAEKSNVHMTVDNADYEASSSFDEDSNMGDELESSDCSSLRSIDEQNECDPLFKLPDDLVALEHKHLSTLDFSSSVPTGDSSLNPLQSYTTVPVENNFSGICERADPVNHFAHLHYKNDDHMPFESGESIFLQMSRMQYTDAKHDMGWLPGHPLKNLSPPTSLDSSKYCKISSNKDRGHLMEGASYFSNMIPNALEEEASDKDKLLNESSVSSNSSILQPWKLKLHPNIFSMNPMNPMLRKNSLIRKPGERCSADHRDHFSCFEFSSVKNPCNVYLENLAVSPRYLVAPEGGNVKNGGLAASNISVYCDKSSYVDDEILINKTTLSHVNKNVERAFVENVSGGSGWESMLNCSNNSATYSAGDHNYSLPTAFEMPLDFVIDKCLLQEILLQYNYISELTITLLEEAFGLQEHLLALRRYHFMEVADWTDLFITSLWRHKWYVTEVERRIPEIQGLLELSVQRSSCERDHNKERLFVFSKEHAIMPISSSAIGVHSFDFVGLGYRVDWPVCIVLTPGALEIYATIFSFLIQVKLAVFSLTEAWCSMKDCWLLLNQSCNHEPHELELRHFNMLTKLRHQVNHFVCTLQQYIQSQLSHVSWCKFQHSLKHKVKDVMNLESVHMAYLTDSLHICFLSEETRSVAGIIESILQCALDFHSSLSGGNGGAGLGGSNSCTLSRINISQVIAIKGKFDKNMKELHMCYLKSPKHEEFGLSRFWSYLNYNEYYSDSGNEIRYCKFPV